MARWLRPDEGNDKATADGVACWLEYSNGWKSEIGEAYRTAEGRLVFSAGSMWVTKWVSFWTPCHEQVVR